MHPLQNHQRLFDISPKCKCCILSTIFLTSQSICSYELSLLSPPTGPIDCLSMKPTLDDRHMESIITLSNYCKSFMFLCFQKLAHFERKKQEMTFSTLSERWPQDLISSNLFLTQRDCVGVPGFYKMKLFHPQPNDKTVSRVEVGRESVHDQTTNTQNFRHKENERKRFFFFSLRLNCRRID